MHTGSARAQLSRRLRPAQQQRGDDRHFRTAQLQVAKFGVTEALFVFGHAVAEAADGAQIVAFNQRIQHVLNLMFAEVHHRLAVGLLVAGHGHGVDGERILLRRGNLLFE